MPEFRHFGRIVAILPSPCGPGALRFLDLVRSLGADVVVDYRTEDFTAGDRQYDVIFDCVGNATFERVDRVLRPGGALLLVVADLKGMLGARGNTRRSGKRVILISFTPTVEDVAFAMGLHLKGATRAVIDRRYRLDNVVEAHRYVDTGRKRGTVVLTIGRDS